MPAQSIRIFLVGHGQSEANLDKAVYVRLPDHRVALSTEGHAQADEVRAYLARQLKGAPRVRILASPYVRARQTSEAIERALTAAVIPFDKREATELRELEYGLFDGIADEDLPKNFPLEYEHYDKHKRFEGEFFAPMPLGKADAMSRTGSRACLGRSCVMHRRTEPIRSLILSLSATASRSELFACSGCTIPGNGVRKRRIPGTVRCNS